MCYTCYKPIRINFFFFCMFKPQPAATPPPPQLASSPPPPVHKGSAEETQSKGREETKKDRGTNRRADKSPRAERQCTAAPGSAAMTGWNSFQWNFFFFGGGLRQRCCAGYMLISLPASPTPTSPCASASRVLPFSFSEIRA